MFLQGEMSLTKISQEIGASRKRFTEWLKGRGHLVSNPSKTYVQNEAFFEVINTEEKAYWLGFLYADGYVGEKLRNNKVKSMSLSLCLAKIDEKHLHKFAKSLNSDALVKDKISKCNGKEFMSCKITIYSTKMCRDLVKLGCTPRKGNFLKFPTEDIVSDDLLPHFVRGYIDGDGCIMHNKNKNGGRLMVLGTYDFLTGMIERMGWRKKRLTQANKTSAPIFSIDYSAKEETAKMLNDLYANASIYLDRKYKKYNEIIALLDGDI